MLRQDAVCREKWIEHFRGQYERWVKGEATLAELCAAADKSLQGYALEAAEALVSRPEMNRPDPAPGEFGDSVGRTATGIRDVIAEAAARHAVAQVLQTRLLKAPGDLQQVLQGRLATDRLA